MRFNDDFEITDLAAARIVFFSAIAIIAGAGAGVITLIHWLLT